MARLLVGTLAVIGLLVEALRPVAMLLLAGLIVVAGSYGRQDHERR